MTRPYLAACPFCGFEPEDDLMDTLYPSGIYWREGKEGFRYYISHKEHLPTDNDCWSMHCNDTAGGCGAAVTADSKEDVIAKWNRRTNDRVERPAICGEQFGVIIDERYTKGRKAITICDEDDGNWFECQSFDAHWLTDLIEVLHVASAIAKESDRKGSAESAGAEKYRCARCGYWRFDNGCSDPNCARPSAAGRAEPCTHGPCEAAQTGKCDWPACSIGTEVARAKPAMEPVACDNYSPAHGTDACARCAAPYLAHRINPLAAKSLDFSAGRADGGERYSMIEELPGDYADNIKPPPDDLVRRLREMTEWEPGRWASEHWYAIPEAAEAIEAQRAEIAEVLQMYEMADRTNRTSLAKNRALRDELARAKHGELDLTHEKLERAEQERDELIHDIARYVERDTQRLAELNRAEQDARDGDELAVYVIVTADNGTAS